jgi:ribosome maturation factor RimP
MGFRRKAHFLYILFTIKSLAGNLVKNNAAKNTPSPSGVPSAVQSAAQISVESHERLQSAITEVCALDGVSLIALEIRGSKERRIVEVFVDKPDGISLDECGDLSHRIGDRLEEIKAFPAAYRLDVSSPGVERPLQHLWQYNRNAGRLLTLELNDGTVIKGRIGAVENGAVTLESPNKSLINRKPSGKATTQALPTDALQAAFPITVQHSAIVRAIVELEF